MNTKHFIIINPTSGKDFTKKQNAVLLKKLSALHTDFEIAYTAYTRHEIELVQQALKKGFRKIISIGGDGTLHHIVNGILSQNEISPTKIQVAVIPLGTGNDWVKQYNIPSNIDKAITIINKNKIVPQDIGQLVCNKKTTYFVNAAGIGLDAFVVNSLHKYKKFGSASYFIASVMGFLHYKKKKLTFYFNEQTVSTKVLFAAIGICSFSGGGMRFTHNVNPKDGLLDISMVKDIRILSFIWHIRKMYNGKLHQHPKVETAKTNEIKITSAKGLELFIQADGELIGQGDCNIKIIPKALNFVIF